MLRLLLNLRVRPSFNRGRDTMALEVLFKMRVGVGVVEYEGMGRDKGRMGRVW